jgi:hypothetical protein
VGGGVLSCDKPVLSCDKPEVQSRSRSPVRTSNLDVRFINEVVHRLSRAAVEPPVEQEPAVAGNLLAVLLREQASHGCLASTRFDVVALPPLFAVSALDHQGEQVRFLAPEQTRLWIGIDSQAIDRAALVDECCQDDGMARNLGPLVFFVDLRQGIEAVGMFILSLIFFSPFGGHKNATAGRG